jgi:hypothetical protein
MTSAVPAVRGGGLPATVSGVADCDDYDTLRLWAVEERACTTSPNWRTGNLNTHVCIVNDPAVGDRNRTRHAGILLQHGFRPQRGKHGASRVSDDSGPNWADRH